MGVDRTDYLMWGAKVDPFEVASRYDELEAELDGAQNKRFDLVYDGMSGEYAIAGRIIAKSDPYEGLGLQEVATFHMIGDAKAQEAVTAAFPAAEDFKLYLFSHFH